MLVDYINYVINCKQVVVLTPCHRKQGHSHNNLVIPVIIVANESDFSLIFMMLDPEHRQSVSWMQLHASGESTGFLSLSTPVRRHACFQLAANQSSLMIACEYVMLMMFPAEFTATHVLPSDYPS